MTVERIFNIVHGDPGFPQYKTTHKCIMIRQCIHYLIITGRGPILDVRIRSST